MAGSQDGEDVEGASEDFPSNEDSPQEPEQPTLGSEAPQAEDGGMRAYLEDALAEQELLSQEETAPGEQDKGLGAYSPILQDGELPQSPGLPAVDVPVPPPEAARKLPLFGMDALAEPGPQISGPGMDLPLQVDAKTAGQDMLVLLVPDERITQLWERADSAKTGVETNVNTLQIARGMLDQIKFARNELMNGKGNYEEAERHINEVEYRVTLQGRVTRWSDGLGLWLFLYEFLWGAALLLVLFFVLGTRAFAPQESDLIYLAGTLVWGGLGGVIGAWSSLVKHISIEQDFDRQHRLWYYNSPLMGIGVGAVVFAILRAGLLSVTGPSGPITSPLIIYLLAWLAGYQHNVFTEIVKRILKVFKIEGDDEEGRTSHEGKNVAIEQVKSNGTVTTSIRSDAHRQVTEEAEERE